MNKNTTNILIAFAAGAAVGAALGILYAPDSGKNTRDKLSFQLDKYKKKLKKTLTDLKDGKEKVVSEAKTEGERHTIETISKAEELMSKIDELTSQVKKR